MDLVGSSQEGVFFFQSSSFGAFFQTNGYVGEILTGLIECFKCSLRCTWFKAVVVATDGIRVWLVCVVVSGLEHHITDSQPLRVISATRVSTYIVTTNGQGKGFGCGGTVDVRDLEANNAVIWHFAVQLVTTSHNVKIKITGCEQFVFSTSLAVVFDSITLTTDTTILTCTFTLFGNTTSIGRRSIVSCPFIDI